MRLRLSDAEASTDLARYLRRCGCDVQEYGALVLSVTMSNDVSFEAALALVREGRCYSCGTVIAKSLASLGSPRCHDCRGLDRADGSAAQAWWDMEVDAFVGVWRALHPDTSVTVLERSARERRRPAA